MPRKEALLASGAVSDRDSVLGAQLASLRRVAALVGEGAASAEVFAAVAHEVRRVVGLPLLVVWRFEPDGDPEATATATVIGVSPDHDHPFQVGTRWPLDGPTICARVRESGRPERIDDFGRLPGTIAGAARGTGIGAAAGAPILVGGEIWGAMSADTVGSAALPVGIEDRLAGFTELVATAIANSASREELVKLADEQAALRRVAELVARQSPERDVFAAVACEVGRLLSVEATGLLRYEDDGTASVVATWGIGRDALPAGARLSVEGEHVAAVVWRSGRPVRMDEYDCATGTIEAHLPSAGKRSLMGTPITVDGRLWGVMIVVQGVDERLPAETGPRVAKFTGLLATAIASLQARAELAASRARIVAATDEERRRVVRDLHDGAQQRLVHTVVTLKLARRALVGSPEARAAELVAEALEQAERAIAELRDLAHGIVPPVLTRGGVTSGIRALAARMPIPVEVWVDVDRMSPAIEATAYLVVAEALTNVTKHAAASSASVRAWIAEDTLYLEISDDGTGGANPSGTGLVGLADRLAVLDGRLRVTTEAGGGTLVMAEMPVAEE